MVKLWTLEWLSSQFCKIVSNDSCASWTHERLHTFNCTCNVWKCRFSKLILSHSSAHNVAILPSLSACSTNETGPLPLCTFSVMGLSMCSSIFSESSPVRSKSGIINELSGFPNSVPTVRCSYTSSSWHGHTSHGILHLLCRKTLVLSAEFGTKIKFDLSTFIQKLLVFIKNYSRIHRSDKMSQFSYLDILISGESYQSKTRYTDSKWCNSVTKRNLDLR